MPELGQERRGRADAASLLTRHCRPKRADVTLGRCVPLQNICAWLVRKTGLCLRPGGSGCGFKAMAGVPNASARAAIAGTKIHLVRNMIHSPRIDRRARCEPSPD